MTTDKYDEKPTYWILTTVHECPVCGRGSTYRERIYDRPRPSEPGELYKFEVVYDWCDAL